MPTGFWKGSSLSFVLDLLAGMLSGGDASVSIGLKEEEYGLSQVFIALNINWTDPIYIKQLTDEVLSNLKSSEPLDESSSVYYPGERTFLTRKENSIKGIPVNKTIWENIKKL
jgi:3-dehydro-L-gulonate 2-dehydrogenase